MEKIKVAHIISTKMDRGGMETFIMNIFKEINREKIEFHFIVSSNDKGSYDEEIYELGGVIHILPSTKDGLGAYKKALYELCKKENFLVVHSHVHYFSGITLQAAKKAGVPIRIAHSHNTSDGCSDTFIRKVYRKFMLSLIKKNSTKMLACSYDAAVALFEDEATGVELIKNGIDLDKFNSATVDKSEFKEELNLPNDSFVIGNVARFEDQKNHLFLIDVFHEVTKLNKNAFLLLVGDGSLRIDIEEKAKSLGVYNNIRLLGVRKDIPNLMKLMDVFVFPSKYEGLGIAIVEAQAAGLRCVVSDQVPNEVNLTGNVEFLDLNKSPEYWATNVLKQAKVKEIQDSMKSYDIKAVTKRMYDIYTSK